MRITNDVISIGVNDRNIDLFEGQYKVKNGMAYNSYLILDEKIAVLDTVDAHFGNEWLNNLKNALSGRKPDYLVIQHMEPDHSANIDRFLSVYPDVTVVSNAKSFVMMKNYFGKDFDNKKLAVGEGDTLSLGKHVLSFVAAPMVHWPEVIVTYDAFDKILFSADGFGKFGTTDAQEGWTDEARRYYVGIVGKFGVQVQSLLKKAAGLDIKIICPLHGPVLIDNLGYYIDLYDKWSSYTPESDGILIAYTSVYGHTEKAVFMLEERLQKLGKEATVKNLARCDTAEAVADAFKYKNVVLATTTYNGGIFPFMREFIEHLTERAFQNRTIAVIENGSWAPFVLKTITAMFEKSKNITFTQNNVKIFSAVNENNVTEINALAEELCK